MSWSLGQPGEDGQHPGVPKARGEGFPGSRSLPQPQTPPAMWPRSCSNPWYLALPPFSPRCALLPSSTGCRLDLCRSCSMAPGPWGTWRDCFSREKHHFPCSLGTAFVYLCSDTYLFNCLGMIGFSPWNWKTQPLWDRGRAKQLAFMSCCLAWTKDIEIRQCKRKVSVLPDYAQMSTGMGEAGEREGAVKWQNHRCIARCECIHKLF